MATSNAIRTVVLSPFFKTPAHWPPTHCKLYPAYLFVNFKKKKKLKKNNYKMLLVLFFLAGISALAGALLVCDENTVVQTYKFEEAPKCPPPPPKMHQSDSMNGTVLIFKPNLNYTEVPAHMCKYVKTEVRTQRTCFFWSCVGESVHKKITEQSIPVSQCRQWIKDKKCGECGSDMYGETIDNCILHQSSIDDDNKMWKTNSSLTAYYGRNAFGDVKKAIVYRDCMIREGFIRVTNPWKTIVSKWGVLHEDEEEEEEDDDGGGGGIRPGKRGGTKEDGQTVVWDKPSDDMCNYILFMDRPGHLVRFNGTAAETYHHHVVVPSLTTTFSLREVVVDDVLLGPHSKCLHKAISEEVGRERVFTTDGDLIVIFIPTTTKLEISLNNNSDSTTKIDVHHGLVHNGTQDELVAKILGRRNRRDAPHVGFVEALDVDSEVDDAHIQYFSDALSEYQYNSAMELAYRLCRQQVETYKQWVIQSKLSPSDVLSHFLGSPVVVKMEDDKFHQLLCSEISKDRYSVLTSLKDDAVNNRCFIRPLINITLNVEEVANETANEIFIGQLSPDLNRVSKSVQYTEACTDRGDEDIRTFTIDGQNYYFKGAELQTEPIEVDTVKIGPITSSFYIPKLHHIELERVVPYKPGEVVEQGSLLSLKEIMEYTNMKRQSELNIGYYDPGERKKYLPAYIPPPNFGKIWGAIKKVFSKIFNWFLNPMFQLFAFIFVIVPLSYVWFLIIRALVQRVRSHHHHDHQSDKCQQQQQQQQLPDMYGMATKLFGGSGIIKEKKWPDQETTVTYGMIKPTE